MDKDKVVVVFTMNGCPYCDMLKIMLREAKLDFVGRDIDEHKDEYEMFSRAVGNEYVPALMLIENPHDNPKTNLYAPERDYNELEDAVKIIREFYGL